MSQDHDMISGIVISGIVISGIVARVEEIAASGDAALAGELDGLAAIMESHFSEERRIRDALNRLDGSAADLLGA